VAFAHILSLLRRSRGFMLLINVAFGRYHMPMVLK
jgi:hypothetical protein